jgi:hypothetical protein
MAKINMYSGKSLGWKKYQNSPAMKKLLSNPKIAAALDKPGERMEFFRDLQNAGNGGVTKNNVKEMLGKYMTGKGRSISRKEASIIAGEMFKGDSKKYISPKNDAAKNDSGAKGISAVKQSAWINAARTTFSVPRTVLTNGGKNFNELADTKVDGENTPRSSNDLSKERNKGSFSRALAAMMRNKRS